MAFGILYLSTGHATGTINQSIEIAALAYLTYWQTAAWRRHIASRQNVAEINAAELGRRQDFLENRARDRRARFWAGRSLTTVVNQVACPTG